jgi:hypothetical protein
MSNLPTVTTGGSRTLTGTVLDVLDASLTHMGSVYKTVTSGSQVWYQNNLGLAGGNLANVRFDLAGTAFEVGLREYATNGLSFRIKVDGVYVTDVMTPTANSGNVVYVKCAFDSAAQRTIQFEMFSGQFGAADQASNQGFIGVASGDAITKTSRPVRGKLLVIGDSIPYGSTGTSQWRAFPKVLADLLGCEEVAFDTVGASGYIQTNSGTVSTVGTRLAVSSTYVADIVLFCAGINDNPVNGGAYTQPTVSAAAVSAWDTYKAANPNARIYATGAMPTSPGDTNIANVTLVQNWLLAAAQGDTNVTAIDTSTWMTTAQAAVYMTGGAPHVVDAGADYYACRFAQVIKAGRPRIRVA